MNHNFGIGQCQTLALRTSRQYRGWKEAVKQFRDNVPVIGEGTYQALKHMRDNAKMLLTEGALFEQMGFKYIGPVDGHDLPEMIELLQGVKEMNRPVLIHVKTIKGKGYPYAEERPWDYHGVSAFDLKTGKALSKGGKSWSSVFGDKMLEIGKKNEKVAGITAAMCSGTGFEKFQQAFPKRFFDVAIAEQHGTTFAAGLAKGGITPVFAVYSSFLQRAYDQLIHDVCMENLHVVFAIDRAGIVGSDGETHQGVFDLSFLSHIPNMTVLSPKNDWELGEMLDFAVNEWNGPIAVRYPRGTAETGFAEYKMPIEYGKAELVQDGEKVAIMVEGHMLTAAAKAAEMLQADGYQPMLVNMRFIKPLDEDAVRAAADETGAILVYVGSAPSVAVGDVVTVFVKSFDKEAKRISLGYKTDDTNPWLLFTNRYNVGDVVSVKIVNMMPFGAFAEIMDGVDGLIHISKIANKRISKPADVLELGQVVDAKIIEIDNEKQKISLSIRDLLVEEEAPVEEVAEEAAPEVVEAE